MKDKTKLAHTLLYIVSGSTILISLMWLFTPKILLYQEAFIELSHNELQPKVAKLFLLLYKLIGFNFLTLGIIFGILVKDPFRKNERWAKRILIISTGVFVYYTYLTIQLSSPTVVVPLALCISIIIILILSKSDTAKKQNDSPSKPEETKMSGQNIGFGFRETMEGGFSLNETDPKTGEEKGKSLGHSLSMHATISINDLQKFITDPNHNGGITGNIDFTPFGENIPAKNGVFNLFSPTDEPKLKLMVYELGFEYNGEDYYVAGKKEVRDDPGFDLWSDTTTLYTKLHKGTDKSGPVVGAGILSLNINELIKLVSTMEVTNAASTAEKAKAMADFGGFFMGDLWDSYAKMAR